MGDSHRAWDRVPCEICAGEIHGVVEIERTPEEGQRLAREFREALGKSAIKRIVILADSKKHDGNCVAGVEIGEAANWIRPVSARAHEEVSVDEQRCLDGSLPRLLDVIDIPLLEPCPNTYQPENWRLDPASRWMKVQRATWVDLDKWKNSRDLWANGNSTYHGINDVIAPEALIAGQDSLRLIHVTGLQLRVFAPRAAFGNLKRRVLGSFRHAGTPYALWVTDPLIEAAYLAQPDGAYTITECYLTVSLGELFEGRHSKLIAGVIIRDANP